VNILSQFLELMPLAEIIDVFAYMKRFQFILCIM